MRRVPALWNYLNAFGRSVGIAGAHVTWPAEPVEGFMISRRASTAGLSGTTHPEELAPAAGDGGTEEFEEMFVEEGFLSVSTHRSRYDWLRRFWIDDNVAFDLALKALERSEPEFVFVYFHLPDVAQHNFWPARQEPGDDNLAAFEPIFRAYEYVDGRLADLLTQVGTTRTAFMVVSDHGAQGRGNVTLFERRSDRLLEAMGYLSFRSDVDVDEIDTESSLVIPGTETGTMVQFWVNVRNPELEDPARRDEVAQRCLAALRGLRFDRSGRRVFEKIGRSSKDSDVLIARLGVTELDLDDSVTLRGRSFPIQDFYAPLSLGGNHTDRGVLIAAGPPFRKGHRLVPEVLRVKRPPWGGFGVRDVAPTVLAAMGLPIPDSMDGRVLEPIFEPAFREGRSFSSEPVEIDWEPYDPEGLDTEAPDLMVEMLRALGYAR
jgi:hypothetical protein